LDHGRAGAEYDRGDFAKKCKWQCDIFPAGFPNTTLPAKIKAMAK
jgi:hypothetical protein